MRDMRDSSAWAWRQMHRTRLHGERLDCPILVCDGEKDWVTRVCPIRTGWARYTNAEVRPITKTCPCAACPLTSSYLYAAFLPPVPRQA